MISSLFEGHILAGALYIVSASTRDRVSKKTSADNSYTYTKKKKKKNSANLFLNQEDFDAKIATLKQ